MSGMRNSNFFNYEDLDFDDKPYSDDDSVDERFRRTTTNTSTTGANMMRDNNQDDDEDYFNMMDQCNCYLDPNEYYDDDNGGDNFEYVRRRLLSSLPSDVSTTITTTTKCILGGPITAVLFIPTHFVNASPDDEGNKDGLDGTTTSAANTGTIDSSLQYDLLYGQGSFLHHVPHQSIWSQQQHPQHQQQQELQQSQEERNYSLQVFTNGNSVHGIRHCCCEVTIYSESVESVVTNQPPQQQQHRRMEILLIFGGRHITFLGRNRNNPQQQQQQQQQFHPIPIKDETDSTTICIDNPMHHEHVLDTTMFDDWIWDCRFIERNKQKHQQRREQPPQHLQLIIGLAHQQIEICDLQIIQRGEKNDAINNDPHNLCSVYLLLHRTQSIINHTIPKCISYCMDIWAPSSSHTTSSMMDNQPNMLIASGTVSNEICIWSLSSSSSLIQLQSHKCTQTSTTHQFGFTYTPKYTLLRGHEGVIHALQFHKSGQYIVSTSDDRTVRLWEYRYNETSDTASTTNSVNDHECHGEWLLKWTAFGHTARGWDVLFCSLRLTHRVATTTTYKNNEEINSDNVLAYTVILSTGEDGSLRIWDAKAGNALATLRGHSCQCIWRVAAIEADCDANMNKSCTGTHEPSTLLMGLTVTGGNNGTVAFYNICDSIPSSWWKQQCYQYDTTTSNDIYSMPTKTSGSWQSTHLIPEDKYIECTATVDNTLSNTMSNTTPTSVGPTVKKSKKGFQQVVIGMKFTKRYYLDGTESTTNYDKNTIGLIIATRSGYIWDLDIHSDRWTELEPWRKPLHPRVNDLVSNSPNAMTVSDGCCMCLHSKQPIIVIGTISGDILISQIHSQGQSPDDKRKTTSQLDSAQNTLVLPGQKHRSVQSLKWARYNILLSFHVQSTVLWYFPNFCSGDDVKNNRSLLYSLCDYTSLVLCVGIKGLVISSALNDESTRLAVGDTRGNLTVFHITIQDKTVKHTTFPTDPISTIRDCHRKEHITDIVWKDKLSIVSVGNDGHICTCSFDSNNNLIKMLSVPVGALTGISRVWNILANNKSNIVVGGYNGNNFAIVDVDSGYEFFRVDTGGRQRTIDVCLNVDFVQQSTIPDLIAISTYVNRLDGRNEINVHGRSDVLTHKAYYCNKLLQCSIGFPVHGESIFDIHVFPIDSKRGTIAIISGSEDCYARITVYCNDNILTSTLLPQQVSGIRAVSSCRFDPTSTVVVLAGKNAVEIFLVDDFDPKTMDEVVVRYVGKGLPHEKLSIDHRINAVQSTILYSEDDYPNVEPVVHVVSGDSNGSCNLYLFSQDFAACENIMYKTDRPILALDVLPHQYDYVRNQKECCIIFVGGTAGEILILSLFEDGNKFLVPLLTYTAHSMGTNSIKARQITTFRSDNYIVRICSCGDDQAICCIDVAFSLGGLDVAVEAHIQATIKVNAASLSALKGIDFISDNLISTTGYDQLLTVWRYDKDKHMVKVNETKISVGDVNCFSKCIIGGSRHRKQLMAVAGAGVEIISLTVKVDHITFR